MEELFELRSFIEEGRYSDALALLGEMEEMSRDDKINKIESFLEILLIHLIKQQAEKRSTRSWDISIYNSVYWINKINMRRKAGGSYLSREELMEAIEESYHIALKRASLEALEGTLDEIALAGKINEKKIKKDALELVLQAQSKR